MVVGNEIEPYDLRVGNLVLYDEQIHLVKSVDKWNVHVYEPIYETTTEVLIKSIQPILLNEQLLLSLGLKHDKGVDDTTFYIECLSFSRLLIDLNGFTQLVEYSRYETKHVFIGRNLYVHLLQNLFKSMTGNDLKTEAQIRGILIKNR